MSAVPVARYLADFASEMGGGRKVTQTMPAPKAPASERSAEELLAEQIEAAFQRGFDAGRIEATAAAEARYTQQTKQFQANRAAERQAWAQHEGEKLVSVFAERMTALEEEIATAAARALAPVMFDKARLDTVAELRTILEDFISRQRGVAIEASGPEDLLTILQQGLKAQNLNISIVPSDDVDVRIRIGETVLETQFAALAEKIAEVLR